MGMKIKYNPRKLMELAIEAKRELVEANRKLVEIFEKKIQDKLAEIWGRNYYTRERPLTAQNKLSPPLP